MLAKLFKWNANWIWKLWYPLLTRLTKNASVIFLNYGYAPDATSANALPLREEDETDRACIQLYHRVAAAIDLQGLRLLEVSCGHGGGASYVTRYLKPQSMVGVDRNARAIALCNRRHNVRGLTFSCGNAMALAFDNNAFDAALNVEASHCYPDVPHFLREVHRVLRPGGSFFYADFREKNEFPALQRQIAESGFQVAAYEDISAGVVRGMQANTAKYMTLIRQLMPRPLQSAAAQFAGVKGSMIFRELESGKTVYFVYHLRKPA